MPRPAAAQLMTGLAFGIAILVALTWFNYNSLVQSEELVKNKWADVEVQYQRRMDLIPNLVETVKGAAKYEQDTLTRIVTARNSWATARSAGNVAGEIEAARAVDSQ